MFEQGVFLNTFFQKKHLYKFPKVQTESNDSACLYCCSFTGKEKDSETGFYYFGARYYDPSLSGLFISVDPMADKYPSISPYAYCAWNPVKLVDPDGKELWKPEIMNDGTINYVAEKGDNAQTLQKQYGLSEEIASKLYGSMSSEGKIYGREVAQTTKDRSEILKYDINYSSGNRMRDIQMKIYHVGFACLYNKVKQGGRDFKLNDFFIGLENNYSGLVSRDGWGNRPKNLYIPALGGGDIPITDFSCQSGGNVLIHQDGSWKQKSDLTGYILLYNQSSRNNTAYEMKAFSFGVPNESESRVIESYRF